MNRYATLPPLPERLSRLSELAVDLWWSWNREARSVFRRLDYTLAFNPAMSVGEAYMEGLLTVEEGTLYDFLEIAARNYTHLQGSAYINHIAADDGPEKVRASFGENHRRLRELKAVFDPTNLFRVNANVAPT